MQNHEFLLVSEAATALGVSANTVRAWAANGRLSEYRHPVNNYRMFKKSDVTKLVKAIRNPKPLRKSR